MRQHTKRWWRWRCRRRERYRLANTIGVCKSPTDTMMNTNENLVWSSSWPVQWLKSIVYPAQQQQQPDEFIFNFRRTGSCFRPSLLDLWHNLDHTGIWAKHILSARRVWRAMLACILLSVATRVWSLVSSKVREMVLSLSCWTGRLTCARYSKIAFFCILELSGRCWPPLSARHWSGLEGDLLDYDVHCPSCDKSSVFGLAVHGRPLNPTFGRCKDVVRHFDSSYCWQRISSRSVVQSLLRLSQGLSVTRAFRDRHVPQTSSTKSLLR